jgi:hypothetical protein
MAESQKLRAGDHVLHYPSGETIVVAHVDSEQIDGELIAWVGWPLGYVKKADCALLHAATDAQHLEQLGRLADSGSEFVSDPRVDKAKEALAMLREAADG